MSWCKYLTPLRTVRTVRTVKTEMHKGDIHLQQTAKTFTVTEFDQLFQLLRFHPVSFFQCFCVLNAVTVNPGL